MHKLNLINFSIGLAVFVVCTVFAMEEDDSWRRQEQWAGFHTTVGNRIIGTTNPTINPITEFSKLHLNALPHPEAYHFYLRDSEGGVCHLVKDVKSQTMRLIRIYGKGGIEESNYVTMGYPDTMLPKETFVNPIAITFKGSRKYPSETSTSTSYPTGLRTYYIIVNGKKIRFDRGHGVAHADTLQHDGVISTQDAENYVPQNIKYNSPIRRDLEDEFREKGVQYKEIAIYHRNFTYEATISKTTQKFTISAPEGFLFMTFKDNGEVLDTYYFPNFVDYEELKGINPTYGHFRELYRIPNLSDWFFNPYVTLGSVDKHQQQVNQAVMLSNKLFLFSPTFFSQFTEKQMPPKARTALLATLLEWNVEAAATLEFLTFQNQLKLAHFYLESRRNFWEFDDRYEAEKMAAMQEFFSDHGVSPTAQKLVSFLNTHLDFAGVQYNLQGFTEQFAEIYRSAAFHWEIPELYPQITTMIAKNGATFDYNLAMISPTDIVKLKKIIGGASGCNTLRAKYILYILDERARQTPSTIGEKLGIVRLYHDNHELIDVEKNLYWERAILEQIKHGEGVTLLDRRKVVDYYSYRGMETEKEFWFGQFIVYMQENPTLENFFQIAEWCINKRAAFLQDLEEQIDRNSAANMLALMIYKLLSHYRPQDYQERCAGFIDHLYNGFGFYDRDPLGYVQEKVLNPFCLEPLASGSKTGVRLKQLYYILLKSVYYPTTIEKIYADIGKPVLSKNSTDHKNEAAFYHKVGLIKDAPFVCLMKRLFKRYV